MHLNWVFPVASSLLPASFEEFRRPNLNAEQLTAKRQSNTSPDACFSSGNAIDTPTAKARWIL